MVTVADGERGTAGVVCVSPATRFSRTSRVSGSSGWNDATSVAIKPAPTTALICGPAQDVWAAVAGGGASAARSAHVTTRRRRIRLRIGRSPDPFTLHAVDVQITPEPSPEEREAILRALEEERADEAEPSPWRRAGLEPEEEDAYATAPLRQSRGATRA